MWQNMLTSSFCQPILLSTLKFLNQQMSKYYVNRPSKFLTGIILISRFFVDDLVWSFCSALLLKQMLDSNCVIH